jgi:acyl-coenzyme A synthetase/AMP-(fatty) acid ligase
LADRLERLLESIAQQPWRPEPMTVRYIAFHATERPGALALVQDGREITFAELGRDVRRFTRALRDFGLPRGASAAIGCEDVYCHWLMRLAFERLGVATASLPGEEHLKSQPFLDRFDLVLSPGSIPARAIRRHRSLTPDWLGRVLSSAEEDPGDAVSEGPDDPLRILYTSGTTGAPKRLLYPRRVHERSVAKSMWFNGVTRGARYLLTIPFSVGSSYANATACIRSGGTVVVESRMPVGQAIASLGITHVALPPAQLKQVLDELPAGFARPQGLTVFSFGAAVASGLRERALARLATELCDMYGSNEAGYVSSTRLRDGAASACVWPGVQVEIVDEHDRPLPHGETGRIRVKTDCMVEGYLDDPATTRRMFRGGWFYAGDTGVLHGPRHLQVLGRSDELLNIGWLKLSPAFLEDRVLGAVEARDVGVCALPNADGIEEVCVVVSGAQCGDRELLARITSAFASHQIGSFGVVRADRIPRNENGKILRDALRSLAASAVRPAQAKSVD